MTNVLSSDNLLIFERIETALTEVVEHEAVIKDILLDLGNIVKKAGESKSYRHELASHNDIWDIIAESVARSFNVTYTEPLLTWYIRVFRGVLLLARNCTPEKALGPSLILHSLRIFDESVSREHDFYDKTVVVYFELLANISQVLDYKRDVNELASIIFDSGSNALNTGPLIIRLTEIDELVFPFLVFLESFLDSEVIGDILTSERCFDIVGILFERFQLLNIESISGPDRILIRILQKIICHESFQKYVNKIGHGSKTFRKILKSCQLIVTSKEDWDNYEIVALLTWIYDLFKEFSVKAEALLLGTSFDVIEISNNHAVVLALLDCLSHLGKYHAGKQYLTHYDAIPFLTRLLGVVHKSIERKTLKKTPPNDMSLEKPQEKKLYPEVKSIIIEILAYLAHDSFENQEKIRKNHGLELVLSNCSIDDNEPFIKERAIVCLKFLLANNTKNQELVASLEAKGVFDQETIKDMGYEAEIVDGKVKLKEAREQN
ncbi:uncharacterized protein PRCAT00002940001 [Priceomyces carsonii]|uniref:uncharacterized protein n=1 Tax=Priceomyces carsonii TaxID=28549 RepID=UPI002EDAFEA1|nr:unnamed protein product [Priceomyces carsonii]